jgi:hypothetical protein
MERVTTIEGDAPIILLAPHGADDINTNYVTAEVAQEFGAHAVINNGWKRSQKFDYLNDFANCNDIRHLNCDVVREEFLNPVLRYVQKIKKKYKEKVFILIIHGCKDSVKDIANDSKLDMILGFGYGKPPSYSCDIKIKNAFLHYLKKEKFTVYEGKENYSGRSKYNLNQLFRKWKYDEMVNSLQLEITKDLRCNETKNLISGLIGAIDSLMLYDDVTTLFHIETKKI